MLTKLGADIENAQSLSNERKTEHDKLSRELSAAKSAIQHRDAEITRLSRDIEATRLFLRDSQSDIQRLSGELDGARTEIERADAERQGMLGQLQEGREVRSLTTAELAVAREEIAFLNAALEDSRQKNAENGRLAGELARSNTEIRSLEKSTADLAAALSENENKAKVQIRALHDQLIDAEAELAKGRKIAHSRAFWMMLFSLSRRRAERRLMASGLFDAEWYTHEYPDAAKSGRSPAEHFLEDGYLRGYLPNPLFDTRWYLERYEDVRRSGMNPLIHYLQHGSRELRNPGPNFETDFYLETNPDVRETGVNPLAHYLRHGRHEGRLPARNAAKFLLRGPALADPS